jgi:hypothetical protein
MLDTNCDIHIVGDKLQTLEFEDNFLTSIIKENGLIENITLKINTPININRRIKVNGMRQEINSLIDFKKYELPEIECNKENEIQPSTIEIIETETIYANDKDIKKIDCFVKKILEKVEYEVNTNNYTPENFMFIFPIMKNNIIASELQTKLTEYWINKFNNNEYIQSINNNYWKNYKHVEYTQYVYLHKHTEGICINTNDSVNASRIMSIRTSKGDGREVVFILGVTEKSLKIVSDKKIGLVYDSHLHVALTRAKCKNYFGLEINGDKDFKWLFKDTKKIEDLFTNEHRGIIRNEYKTTIFYLSHNYKKLLESNKTRFLQNIKDCVPKSCSARLGNFLLPDIYRKTINGIFTVYAELSIFFQENNIAVRFYERTDGNNYLKLEDFEKYKESFKLLHEDIESRPWSVILSPRVFSVFTSRGKGRRKTQKEKRKKQKAKK